MTYHKGVKETFEAASVLAVLHACPLMWLRLPAWHFSGKKGYAHLDLLHTHLTKEHALNRNLIPSSKQIRRNKKYNWKARSLPTFPWIHTSHTLTSDKIIVAPNYEELSIVSVVGVWNHHLFKGTELWRVQHRIPFWIQSQLNLGGELDE